MFACESSGLACVEKALDLLVDAAHGLYLSMLVYRTRDCDRLLDGDPRDGRQESIQFR